MIRFNNLAISILLMTLVSGCTWTHNLNIQPRLDALPPTTKNQVHTGVYYSPQFANLEYSRISGGDQIWVVPIGAASVRLFDDLLPRVFEKTTKIPKLTADEISARGVDAVIAPTIEHFDFRLGMNADNDEYSVSYRMTLYTKRCVPAASWIVFGKASKNSGMIDTLIENDMADAAVKFLQEFERNAGAALAAIAKNPSNQSNLVNPKSIVLSAKLQEPLGFDSKQVEALKEAGVVILQVSVRNVNEKQFIVRGSDMRLRLKDGKIIEPSSFSSTLSLLEQISHTGGVVAGLFGAPIGLLTMLSQDSANDAKRNQLTKALGGSLFQEQTLSMGKEVTGVVIFRLPKGVKADDGVILAAWAVDPPNADGAQIEAPLYVLH